MMNPWIELTKSDGTKFVLLKADMVAIEAITGGCRITLRNGMYYVATEELKDIGKAYRE